MASENYLLARVAYANLISEWHSPAKNGTYTLNLEESMLLFECSFN